MTATDYVAVSRHLEQSLGVPPLIRVNGKAPLDSAWTTGPRRDPSGWRRRLVNHPQNVGMLTGDGLVVVDVDLYHEEEGAEDAVDSLYDLGLPRNTVTGITGGGGRHLLYRTGAAIASRPLEGYPGIDIKGQGGMVVVAPSVHPSTGRAYEWEYSWAPGDLEPAELPAALVELFGSGGHRSSGQLDERDEYAVHLLEQLGGHSPRQRDTATSRSPGPARRHAPADQQPSACSVAAWSRCGRRTGPTFPPASTRYTSCASSSVSTSRRCTLLCSSRRMAFAGGAAVTTTDRCRCCRAMRTTARWERSSSSSTARLEGHPAAIGFTVLVFAGVWLGRQHRVVLGGISHASNLWGVSVGDSSTGAKGTSGRRRSPPAEHDDRPHLGEDTVQGRVRQRSGCSVNTVRDDGDGRTEIVITDAEMAAVFRTCAMKDSTLSETLRKAFDGEPLEWRTVGHHDIVASKHHIGVSGAITPDELRLLLDDTAIRNGLGNRFLFLWSHSAEPLPFGGNIDAVRLGAIADVIGERLGGDVFQRTYVVRPDTPFGDRWKPWYVERAHGVDHGAVRTLTARMRVHLPRIAAVYAALDGAGQLTAEHFDAARAWTDYGTDTVRLVFGEGVTGKARKLLEAVRKAGLDGLDGTAQRDLFSKNLEGDELDALRDELEQRGLVWTTTEPTGGRPRTVSYAVTRLP